MTRIHLLILWVLTLIAGAILFQVKGSKHQPTEENTPLSQGDVILTSDQLRTSGGLRLSKGGETSSLLLNETGWVVSEQGDFPANIDSLSMAFDTLRKIKISQGLTAGPDAWERFGLNEDAEKENDKPKALTILDEGGSDALKIYIGKQRQASAGRRGPGGRFIRLAGDDTSIYIVEDSFGQLSTASANWIDKKLPQIEAPLSVSVKPEAGEGWTVSRKTAIGDMILQDLPEGYSTEVAQTAPLKEIFSSSTFIELLSSEEVEKRKAAGESREVTIKAASGITYIYTLIPELKEETSEESATPQADSRNYMVSLKVTSGPSAPVPPAADATEADQAGYQALLSNMKAAEKAYADHKKLEGRYFLVSNFTINALTKQKSELQKKKKEAATAASSPVSAGQPVQATQPSIARQPGILPGGVTPPARPEGGQQPRKRIEAFTPPIAIPQTSKNQDAPEAEDRVAE